MGQKAAGRNFFIKPRDKKDAQIIKEMLAIHYPLICDQDGFVIYFEKGRRLSDVKKEIARVVGNLAEVGVSHSHRKGKRIGGRLWSKICY